MTQLVVLTDYRDGQRSLDAGDLIDPALYPVASMQTAGLVVVTYVPSTMAAIIAAFLVQRRTNPLASLLSAFVQAGVAPTVAATFIPDPPIALDVDTDALAQIANPIVEWSCAGGDRKFDPRTALFSMAFTFWKSTTAAHKITIDVTTGGNAGWTTDAGLNTNFDVPNSSGSKGQWLVRIDLPRKRVSVIPAS